MKRILLILIFITGCNTYKSFKIKKEKDNRYLDYASKAYTSFYGWGSQIISIRNEKLTKFKPIEGDRMWYQGFYGTFLILDYIYKKRSKQPIKNFIQGTKKMLEETEGIYLRDNSFECIEQYKNGKTHLEASKDQIIGLVTGLFMIYYYIDDKIIKKSIKEIITPLSRNLETRGYMLYNEKEHRFYDSAFYAILHYYGLSKAFAYINDNCLQEYTLVQYTLSRITLELLKYKRRLIDKELYIEDINLFNIPELKNKRWYKQLLQSDEFGVNLNFYELLIAATIDKKEAKKIIKVLEHIEVRKLKHLNLAALYFYCIKKWNIKGKYKEFYKKVLERDDFWYNPQILPNSLKYGCIWPADVVNGFIQRNFSLNFETKWNQPIETTKIFRSLLKPSNHERVDINPGTMYILRFLLAK